MEELGLPGRLLARLQAAGVTTIEQLAALNQRELRDIQGIGPRAVQQIELALAARGLHLADDPWGSYTCARHGEPSWDTQLATMFLCDGCAQRFITQAFAGTQPGFEGEYVEGYCLHCNQHRKVRLRQWFLCGVCERVVRSIGRSLVADQFVLDWWEREAPEHFPDLRLSLVDRPELRPRNRTATAEKIAAIDFLCEEGRSGSYLFGIELKTGRSYIRGRSIGTKMNQFQLDHGDVDDIVAVVQREGNLPVYLFHAQVVDRAEPPTVHFVGLGLWWTDLFSMSGHYMGSRRRPLEAKTAAYYDTRMFRESAEFVGHVVADGPSEMRARLEAEGIPALYKN